MIDKKLKYNIKTIFIAGKRALEIKKSKIKNLLCR
jgi:hypothetical protein